MKNYAIREIRNSELPILEQLLYEAIFQLPENPPLPYGIIFQPEIYVYIDRFGALPDDYCLVAEVEGKIAGAVWIRILDGEPKGFGNIDSITPEFAIALFKEYRNQGIGKELMLAMQKYMQQKGYKAGSLSVDKRNYAFSMYLNTGFEIIKENDHDYLMVCDLTTTE